MPSQQLTQQHPQQDSLQQSSISSHLPSDTAAAAADTLAGIDTNPASSWHRQHTAAIAQWRLLTDSGQDATSRLLLSCSSAEQLLFLAEKLLKRPVSKWHYARLAAMAVVLLAASQPEGPDGQQQLPVAAPQQQDRPVVQLNTVTQPLLLQQQQQVELQQPGDLLQSALARMALNASAANGNGRAAAAGVLPLPTQEQQQQSDVQEQASPMWSHQQQEHQQQPQHTGCVKDQLLCRALQAVTSPCVDTAAPTLHSLRGVHLSEVLHAAWLLQQRDPAPISVASS